MTTASWPAGHRRRWALLAQLGDDMIVHVDAAQADPFPREYCTGQSVRLDLGFPGLIIDAFPEVVSEIVAAMFTPMLGFGIAWEERWPGYVWDDDNSEYVDGADTRDQYRESWTVLVDAMKLKELLID